MNSIKRRKEVKARRSRQYALALGFCLLAVIGGGFEFMLWYLLLIPTWLFAVGEICCMALMVDGMYIIDALEEEKAPLWDRHDI